MRVVDVTEVAKLCGFQHPVYLSMFAWDQVCKDAKGNDETPRTRVWDVMWTLRSVCRTTKTQRHALPFQLKTLDGKEHRLVAFAQDQNDEPCIIVKVKKSPSA